MRTAPPSLVSMCVGTSSMRGTSSNAPAPIAQPEIETRLVPRGLRGDRSAEWLTEHRPPSALDGEDAADDVERLPRRLHNARSTIGALVRRSSRTDRSFSAA